MSFVSLTDRGMRLGESAICRLCAAEAPGGCRLFETDGSRSPATLVNSYLPLKVTNDGKYPQIICPGCNIQLEATAQFLDLVIEGQKKLRDLWNKENPPAKSENKLSSSDGKDTTNNSIYTSDHAISIRMGIEPTSKRRRGRPKKVFSANHDTALPNEAEGNKMFEETNSEKSTGKRRRVVPKRFSEVVQGKELDRILREEGVSDDEIENQANDDILHGFNFLSSDVIGHIEETEPGNETTKITVNVKGERGRKKGVKFSIQQYCKFCSSEFNSMRQYMAHVALCHFDPDNEKSPDENQENNEIFMKLINSNDNEIPLVEKKLDVTKTELLSNGQDISESLIFEAGPSMPDLTTDILINQTINKEEINFNIPTNTEEEISQAIVMEEVSDDKNMISNNIEQNYDNSEKKKNAGKRKIKINPSIKALDLNKFQCLECEKIFSCKQNCEVHLRVFHKGERSYKCKYCNFTCAYKINLQRHLIAHVPKGEKGFACDICGKILSHPSSVLYHKETFHNNGKQFICKKCGKSFKHRQLLKRHQTVHSNFRPFACKECNGSFKSKSNLMNHMQTHNGIKKFVCDICETNFKHKTSLLIHMRSHSGEKPYKCNVCGKAFGQNGNLSEHMRIHTGEKPYTCHICDRKFTTSSQHRLHTERHKGEWKWLCQQCGKKFSNKDAWKCHMKRHRGEKPFACTTCSRRFTDRWSLHKHTRLHTGEKPFVCNYCGRSFADSSNLTKHKKTHREYIEAKHNLVVLEENECIEDDNNHVLCVTYNSEENIEEPPTFRIIHEDQVKNLNSCILYDAETELLVDENGAALNGIVQNDQEEQNGPIFDQFVDEEGNPIQFTLHDGTHFTVTSSDGKLLQIQNEELILTTDPETDFRETDRPEDSRTVRFLAADDSNLSQYFTIT